MTIYLINHYAVPTRYYPLSRPAAFAKGLEKRGHEVKIFAASTVHNSNINLVKKGELYQEGRTDDVSYVLIRCSDYRGNGLKRAVNVIEFSCKLHSVIRNYPKPDAIVATSFDPLSCYIGIKIAKKYGAKAIAEIADLWPETPVAYGMMKAGNPIVKLLRQLEKKIYKEADAVIFTIEGGYEYIKEQGWERDIPESKVFHINNGINLSEFNENMTRYMVDDKDLEREDTFKAIYTGAVRTVNHVIGLLDVAKELSDTNIKFLIWGDGEEIESIKEKIKSEGIRNVVLKGKVEKKYIPYILSKADVCLMHGRTSSITRFGMSLNKSFDYLAAGKPIITTIKADYDYVTENKAGFFVDSDNTEEYAKKIEWVRKMDSHKYNALCRNARNTATKYDFERLTDRLEKIIKGI